MSKPFDYYAGYPGQQATPKWVGVVIGSVFGGLLLITIGLGIRLVMPARTAQASVAPAMAPAPVPQPALVAAAVADAPAAAEAPAASRSAHRSHGHKVKKGGHAVAFGNAKNSKAPKYKKRQMFAKSVSRKDKKARDDLDKMLGL
ncbi:MAG: hypothetical protein ABI321_13385 [Polyangia bacterium]